MDSSGGRLNRIQRRVLESLTDIEPPFVFSGGGALVGVYLGHRTTRDLDLFWRRRATLDDLSHAIEHSITAAGLSVEVLRTSPAFVQLRVSDINDAVVVDLIADAADNLEPPVRQRVGDAEILVDTPGAILAEKLCALLERSELRDLIDIEALVRSGEDLETAISKAPRRDSGFSPLTLAWVLRDLDIRVLAPSAGLDDSAATRLDAFRLWLIDSLIDPARAKLGLP